MQAEFLFRCVILLVVEFELQQYKILLLASYVSANRTKEEVRSLSFLYQ